MLVGVVFLHTETHYVTSHDCNPARNSQCVVLSQEAPLAQ